MTTEPNPETGALAAARDEFVAQWGALGSAWGINRTMAQIHAFLMTSPAATTTDEIMNDLKISRGNAHGNLRELVSWGLAKSIFRKGERKEYFEAEKDVWKIFCIILRERRRREVRPAMTVLSECAERTRNLKGAEAASFTKQIESLRDFLSLTDDVITKVTRLEQSKAVPWALKFLK